jgi:hypothetical protein
VSGTKRSLGAEAPGGNPAMSAESNNSQKLMLATAIATGTKVAKWARKNSVPERTAYSWAAEPEVRAEVESIRRRVLDETIGKLAHRANWAVNGVVRLGNTSNSDSVKLSAHRAVLSDFIAVSKYTGLEGRIAKLEDQNRARANNAS